MSDPRYIGIYRQALLKTNKIWNMHIMTLYYTLVVDGCVLPNQNALVLDSEFWNSFYKKMLIVTKCITLVIPIILAIQATLITHLEPNSRHQLIIELCWNAKGKLPCLSDFDSRKLVINHANEMYFCYIYLYSREITAMKHTVRYQWTGIHDILVCLPDSQHHHDPIYLNVPNQMPYRLFYVESI